MDHIDEQIDEIIADIQELCDEHPGLSLRIRNRIIAELGYPQSRGENLEYNQGSAMPD